MKLTPSSRIKQAELGKILSFPPLTKNSMQLPKVMSHYLTLMFHQNRWVWELSDLNIAFHDISLIMSIGAHESLKSTSPLQ